MGFLEKEEEEGRFVEGAWIDIFGEGGFVMDGVEKYV